MSTNELLCYEDLLDDYYTVGNKRSAHGEFKRVDFSCSVLREQGRFLYDIVRNDRPASVLEIGLAWGGSAIHICCALRDNGQGTAIALDPLQYLVWGDVALLELRRLQLDSHFTFIQDRSDLVLPQYVREEKRFDFIFVDGDHSLAGVFVDWHYCRKLLNVGGKLVFDDIGSEPMLFMKDHIASNHPEFASEGIHMGRFGLYKKIDEGPREA